METTKHLVSTKQFSSSMQLQMLFDQVDNPSCFTQNGSLRKIMSTLFYQPSTRTRLSFESAMYRLGGSVISTENAAEFSSHIKGETLEDTIRVVSEYADLVVLRHPEKGASCRAAPFCQSLLINAGDGDGEHPTQALLDVYTIYKELDRVDGLTIALVGDLRYGRTIHSLINLLGLYKHVNLLLISPPNLCLPSDVQCEMSEDRGEHTIHWRAIPTLQQALCEKPDVVYMTRAQQRDYFYDRDFCFSNRELDLLGERSIIMHPLPRVAEIDPVVDSDPRACYFKQVANGLRVRMALISLMLAGHAPWF